MLGVFQARVEALEWTKLEFLKDEIDGAWLVATPARPKEKLTQPQAIESFCFPRGDRALR